jgi:hypothetical protein
MLIPRVERVWEFGNLGIWEFGNLGIWESENLPKTPAGSHICSKNCERCFHDPSGVALNFNTPFTPKVERSLSLRSVTKASRPVFVYCFPKKRYSTLTLYNANS